MSNQEKTNERVQSSEETINESALLHVIGRKFADAYNAGREKTSRNGRYLSLQTTEGSSMRVSQEVVDKPIAYVSPDEDYMTTEIQIIGSDGMKDEFERNNFKFDRVVYKVGERLAVSASGGKLAGVMTKEVLGWVESEENGRKVTTCVAESHEVKPDEINFLMSEISSAREVEEPKMPLGITGVTIS